jgi:hypothetical protein
MINFGNFFFSKFEALLSTSTIVVFMSKDSYNVDAMQH